jgi:hypothetical protein
MTLGFENTIKDAERKKAIPFFFEIDGPEAYQLLRELNRCKEVRASYTFEQAEDTHDIKLRLFGEMPESEELTEIANAWFRREIGISYKDHPIYIVNPPKKKQPRDRRFVRKLKMRNS